MNASLISPHFANLNPLQPVILLGAMGGYVIRARRRRSPGDSLSATAPFHRYQSATESDVKSGRILLIHFAYDVAELQYGKELSIVNYHSRHHLHGRVWMSTSKIKNLELELRDVIFSSRPLSDAPGSASANLRYPIALRHKGVPHLLDLSGFGSTNKSRKYVSGRKVDNSPL